MTKNSVRTPTSVRRIPRLHLKASPGCTRMSFQLCYLMRIEQRQNTRRVHPIFSNVFLLFVCTCIHLFYFLSNSDRHISNAVVGKVKPKIINRFIKEMEKRENLLRSEKIVKRTLRTIVYTSLVGLCVLLKNICIISLFTSTTTKSTPRDFFNFIHCLTCVVHSSYYNIEQNNLCVNVQHTS